MEPFNAVVNARRVAPAAVALAALTTVLGMLPLVTDAFYAAMAVTIMCGLAFATVLTIDRHSRQLRHRLRIPNPPENA